MDGLNIEEQMDEKTKATILEMEKSLEEKDKEIASKKEEINNLKNELAFLKNQILNKNKKIFGKSSEQLDNNQISLFERLRNIVIARSKS